MYQMGGAQEEVSYREIFVNRSSDKWKEITVNTGGIASTLQDVKAHQRCGGYVYQKQNNRFIYWRTSDEVLELVEDSLDVDLTGSQLRLRFSGSHVLEGVSIAETANSVVILVPTVSSVHRFMFPHPERLLKQGVKHPLSKSIFCDANEADASDPNSYHVLSSNPSAILTGASYLTVRSEAVFALSMANSSIHVITMDLLSGTAIVTVLNNDSVLPRFLGNIMGALLRNKDNNAIFGAGGGSEGSCVSMVLHTFNRELYLFSLEREGQLRVWLCSKASYLMTETLVENSDIRTLKGQNHKLRKGFNSKGELILCAHLQGSTVVVLKPVFESGVFRFSKLSLMSPPPNLEMVDMTLGGGGSVWCSWLTGQELPMVTQFKIPVSNWASVDLVKPQLEVNQTSHFVMDPAQLHLDALFSSGFFTAHDICKALSVYRTSTMVDPTADIREQICSIVESEIYSEIGDAAVDDDEFLEISQRSWSRLYSCCIQFLVSGITPVGLFWLPSASCLVLIKPHGFSLVREITPLEMAYLGNSNDTKDGYGKLLQCLRMIDMDEPIERLDLALHLGESVQSCIEEAAKLIPQSKALTEAIGIISRDDFGQGQGIMETLINELRSPEEFDRPEPEGDSFCSESGISAVVATFRDMCRLRLEICLKTALVLRLVSPSSEPRGLSERLAQLSRTYHFLRWTCTTNVSLDTPLVASFALAHTSLMLPSIVDSALSLANTLWPENESDLLPRHLLATKNYVLLDTMARLVGCGSWTVIMVKSYLETGEANKAYDLVMSWSEATTSYFLKMAAIFEQYRQPDLVIAIASKAISVSNPTPGELETLHSMLFLHELQLGHYEAAYSWVKTISACAGTAGGSHSDCLHHLILDMLANGRLRELLSFPYMGLLNQLERMLESRARTMPIESASTYYDLLYALHVKHDNFKKAASIMFEHGMRSETVDTQWRCYGACLMTIMLVDPEQAWVVKPTGTVDPNQDTIEVLEVNDIRREYELARARVQLGNCPTDSSASEVISQCIRSGRYKYAMRLAALCRSSCAPIIEAFTAACVVLTESKSAPWQWVRHNEIGNIMVTEQNAVDMAWCILERLIMSYERPNETLLHRTAANKLMELARFLPTWLLVSYKKKNASELLRLYLRHGHLQQASDLACDYLKAGLGWGKEDFSMETPLLSTAPPLCLPISCIDLLILELKEYKMEEELQSMLSKYVETAKRVSQDKAIAVK